jgi:hypothetical protein
VTSGPLRFRRGHNAIFVHHGCRVRVPPNSSLSTGAMIREKHPVTADSIVLFADILGFSALTEQNHIDAERLCSRDRPFVWSVDDLLNEPRNPLTDAYWSFHNALKWAIRTSEMSHALTAISFSDSAFIATDCLFEAAKIAISLSRSMLSQRVPVRMGLAFGSFLALRFRSDIGLDGGDHAAQFLGTAVVRSHQAEACGIKGIRILLHPSVEPLLVDSTHNPGGSPHVSWIECSKAEQEKSKQIGVRYELNYWCSAPGEAKKAWRGLQSMWATAPDSELEHYQATAEAINRMRIIQGDPPLTNLRRLSLPRRRR